MIFGAILAGGIGSRMHTAQMPKQFLPLGDRPIIIHTVQKYLDCPDVDAVYIGINSDWFDFMQELLDRYLPRFHDRINLTPGGSDRSGTILNLINAIEADFGASNEHILLTHDAVRPFFSQRMLKENIAAARAYGAVNTVSPAIDTIVVSENGTTLSDIPNRSTIYHGQCPQSFRLSLLKELYLSLTPEEKSTLTDACKICLMRNYPVHIVKGSVLSMKITTPEDYLIAQAIANTEVP